MFNLNDLTYWTNLNYKVNILEMNANDWKYLLKYSSWSRPCGQWPLHVLREVRRKTLRWRAKAWAAADKEWKWVFSVGAAWDPIKYKKMARHGKTNQNIRSWNVTLHQCIQNMQDRTWAQNNTRLPQQRIKPPIQVISKMPECQAQGQRSLQWSLLHRIF